MGHKESVNLTIQHKILDKVPKSELEIDKSLRDKLFGRKTTDDNFVYEENAEKHLKTIPGEVHLLQPCIGWILKKQKINTKIDYVY